jgi:hypothetical protein
MIDIESLTSQVKRNCNISDARYWGDYSVCGLLIRLRELYRAEKGIRLWEKIPQEDIGRWISEREEIWKELRDADFRDISVNGNAFDPFETEGINAELEKEGLVYGAGLGLHMKPSFFLGSLAAKEAVDGFEVYIAGNEFARDLSDAPAMLQGSVIFARTDITKLLLWEKFEEMRCRKMHNALSFAFSRYGVSPEDKATAEMDRVISGIASSESETYIYHELGEACEGRKIGMEWKNLLMSIASSKAELFARAVKDILSDTSEKGMLNYIITQKKEGSLGFYIVFLSGLRKLLFPEIIDAFKMFTDTGDWSTIENARKARYIKASGYMERLLYLYRSKKGRDSLLTAIDKEMLKGLL